MKLKPTTNIAIHKRNTELLTSSRRRTNTTEHADYITAKNECLAVDGCQGYFLKPYLVKSRFATSTTFFYNNRGNSLARSLVESHC